MRRIMLTSIFLMSHNHVWLKCLNLFSHSLLFLSCPKSLTFRTRLLDSCVMLPVWDQHYLFSYNLPLGFSQILILLLYPYYTKQSVQMRSCWQYFIFIVHVPIMLYHQIILTFYKVFLYTKSINITLLKNMVYVIFNNTLVAFTYVCFHAFRA